MKRTLALVLIILAFCLSAALPVRDLPGFLPGSSQAWPTIDLVQVVSGLSSPLHIAHAGDGSGRMFVVERAGRIKIVQGSAVSGVFLDIIGRVRSPGNGGGSEEGLLSLAFPPGYGSVKEHFYVYYTNKNGDNQVSRFSHGINPDQADPSSEELILLIPHPVESNHNGGQLAFGPDEYLYIGTGDGGGSGDPLGNAQNSGSLLGKILRIDVDPQQPNPISSKLYLPLAQRLYTGGSSPALRRYAIPQDNPFIGNPAFRPEIWAFGLRNPWRFAFDRLSGDLWIGDVGQNTWEEIDFQPAASSGGQNYGWNILEGNSCYNNPNCNPVGFTPPVWVYDHSSGNCSVTGGTVYRGPSQTGLSGIYFYADYCTGRVWGLRAFGSSWENALLLDSPYNLAGLGENQIGEVFLADLSGGTIYQLVAVP